MLIAQMYFAFMISHFGGGIIISGSNNNKNNIISGADGDNNNHNSAGKSADSSTAVRSGDVTDRQIIKDIVKIGVPSFFETLFTTVSNIIDSKMVSAMGVTAISAVSVTAPPRLFILSVFIAMNTVITSLVAKCVGENDRETANRHFDSIIKIVIVLSIIFSIISVALARPIMFICSHQMDTLDASVTYFRIVMAALTFNTVYMTINAALRGCGHTGLTFTSNVIFCFVNIFFNYLLIEGHMGFPALGIAGAAIATAAGWAAAFVFMVIMGCKKDLFVNIPYCISRKYKISREGTEEIRTMSRSTITDGLATRVSILIIGSIVARIGSYQMAVYSVGTHLMSVNQALGTGLMTSGVVLIGRCFGAKDKALLNRYKKQIIRLSYFTAVPLGLAIILGGRWFYGFFSSDPEFIHMGAVSCIFIGVITLSQTLKFSYTGCLQGVGAMKEVMRASIISFAGVNLGVLALTVFVLDMGIWGAWTGSLASQTFQAFMLWRYTKKLDAFKE